MSDSKTTNPLLSHVTEMIRNGMFSSEKESNSDSTPNGLIDYVPKQQKIPEQCPSSPPLPALPMRSYYVDGVYVQEPYVREEKIDEELHQQILKKIKAHKDKKNETKLNPKEKQEVLVDLSEDSAPSCSYNLKNPPVKTEVSSVLSPTVPKVDIDVKQEISNCVFQLLVVQFEARVVMQNVKSVFESQLSEYRSKLESLNISVEHDVELAQARIAALDLCTLILEKNFPVYNKDI